MLLFLKGHSALGAYLNPPDGISGAGILERFLGATVVVIFFAEMSFAVLEVNVKQIEDGYREEYDTSEGCVMYEITKAQVQFSPPLKTLTFNQHCYNQKKV